MSRRGSLAALLIALRISTAGADGGTDPSVLATLRELGRAAATVHTLRARFVQEKHVSIVRDVLRSSGTFVLDKRGAIAWDVTDPDPVRIVIRKDGVYAGGKRVAGGADDTAKFSPLPMLEGLNEVFAGVSEQTAKSFDVTLLDRDRLRLKPRSQRLADWVTSIEIKLGSSPRVPVQVELEEPSGDRTEITFRDVEVNPKLADAAFAP
jgi:outer membrane lipoprotein-sorting protein